MKRGFYDVVISGAGVSGLGLAALLKKSPLFKSRSVLVLDRTLPNILPAMDPKEEGGNRSEKSRPYSNRIYALNESSLEVLQRTGAWEVVCDEYRHWPAYRMVTLDSKSPSGFTSFPSSSLESDERIEKPVAHFLESEVIVSSLLKVIQDSPHKVTDTVSMNKNEITGIQRNQSSIQLTLEGGQTIETSLLVGAEGYKSNVRKLAKMKCYQHEYHHHALVGTLSVECSDGNRAAWQRFLPSGPIASLPLNRDTASLVLFAEKSNLDELITKTESEIVEQLNAYWSEDYGDNFQFTGALKILSRGLNGITGSPEAEEPKPPMIRSVDKSTLATFPVGFGHASHYVQPNIALIGDAAHRIHPLAGQGANLSLLDCEVLSTQVEEALGKGENPGKYSSLLEYERKAQKHNLTTQLFCDLIYRMYGTNSAPVVALRSLASIGVNNLEMVNKSLVHWASSGKNAYKT